MHIIFIKHDHSEDDITRQNLQTTTKKWQTSRVTIVQAPTRAKSGWVENKPRNPVRLCGSSMLILSERGWEGVSTQIFPLVDFSQSHCSIFRLITLTEVSSGSIRVGVFRLSLSSLRCTPDDFIKLLFQRQHLFSSFHVTVLQDYI